MVIYWILASLIVLIQLLPGREEKHYKVKLYISLFLLFVYGAFRVDYGLDYESYVDYFEDVKQFGLEANDRMELGYYFLNKLLPSFRVLFIIQTLLICIAYHLLFRWYIPSKLAWLGFLLLFLNGPQTVFFMLNGIRNGMAISIFILSTYFIHKRKLFLFGISIFVAYWFHSSVILFAPIAYFVANGKTITKKNIIFWLTIMVFTAISFETVLLNYIDIFINTYFERYSTYVDFVKDKGEGAGILALIFSLLTTVLFFLNVKGKTMTDKENMIVKLTFLFFFSFLLGPLNVRMSQYFAPFFVAGSILIVYKSSNRAFKYTYVIVVFIYLLYALKIWIENPYFDYSTYQSVLF